MNMTLSRLLTTLRARWREGLLAFALVLAAGVALNAWLPRQYTAEAAVMLDVRTADPIAGTPMQPLAVTNYMATQVDLLLSERVLRGALKRTGLDQDAELHERWLKATQGRGDKLSWLSDGVLKNAEVVPARESNVITLRYTDRTDQRAAEVVNAIVESYIATTVELRAEGARQQDTFFDQRAKALREAVQRAQAALSEHQRQAGLVANDERLDIENARLSDLSSQLLAARNAVQDSAARLSQANRQPEHSPDVLGNPLVSSLMGELARQQVRLRELETRLQSAHPSVIEARTTIDNLRREIEAQRATVTASMGVSRAVGESRVAQLQAAVDTQRAKVLDLKLKRERAEVLQRDLDNAVQAYGAVFKRSDTASMEGQATLNNVSRIKEATPPPLPSRPRVFLNLAVTLVLGVVAALVTVVVREVRDPRLRDEGDIERVLGHVALGRLPNHDALRGPSDHWRRLVAPPQIGMGGRHG
ncbi:GNVR domain-containing protein [Azohydromonas caseinilytica]|uniref:Chain length determinant protein EpsF n=1 Tax=Azohydromonas caseinilytica TaxID=2728836 RepID=A0A848FF82_9BURK|nr:GNVR domain-containing protein [Azohydromonas caseinilytica]NML17766.1 chain length determinant protein EpsF [Azohydromonas caseinilytica]